MSTEATPANVGSNDGLGPGAGARRLAEAIDPLRRKGAPDHLTVGCAAQMLEVQAAEIERLRAALQALVSALDSGHSLTIFDAWTGAEAALGPNA